MTGVSPKVILASLAAAGLAIAVPVFAINSGGPAQATSVPQGPTWKSAAVVLGTAALNGGEMASVGGLACPSPGNCTAAGNYTTSAGIEQVFVASQKSGTWGKAATVAGIPGIGEGEMTVSSVSCASAGNCALGGSFSGGTSTTGNPADAFLAGESGGKWARAKLLTALGLKGGSDLVTSVACPAAGDCVAAGTTSHATELFVVDEMNGAWQDAKIVTGTALSVYSGSPRVACVSAGNCFVVVGGYVAEEKSGTWGAAKELPSGLTALSLSCVPKGACTVGGTDGTDAEVDTEAAGTWGTPVAVAGNLNAGGYARVTAVSCPSNGNCGAVGSYTDSGDLAEPFLVSEKSKAWQPASEAQQSLASVGTLTGISCSTAGNCVAISDDGYVVSEVSGIWGTGQAVPGTSAFTTDPAAISCASVIFCAVGGKTGDQAFVASEQAATSTAMSLSAATVPYGDEQKEHVSVVVASKSFGIPNDKVTIDQGTTTICTITLASGKGGCTLPADRLAYGKHSLTALYHGAPQFLPSSSGAKTLAVTKAKTATRVTLSHASVAYGDENILRISVSVSPQYGGMPAGKVTVQAGRTTICVLAVHAVRDLKAATGTCDVPARKLAVGSYPVTATFSGNADFLASTATKKTLVVTKLAR